MKKSGLMFIAALFLAGGCAYNRPVEEAPAAPEARLKAMQTEMMRQIDSGGDYTDLKFRYTAYEETLLAGVVMNDRNGNLVDASFRYFDMMGYTSSQLQELSAVELAPDDWYSMKGGQARLARTQEFVTFEKDYETRTGRILPVLITGWVLRGEDGSVIGTGALVRERTEMQKRLP
ncbi:MAG: PAS domain S-box protein [Elusimicrobiaceae bacterium]|nr:PAS domain S-box protein [Elusimicrobiaceae bacterium]